MSEVLTSHHSRPTIGFLMGSEIHDLTQQCVLKGAFDEARERDVNLICLAGGYMRSPIGFQAQANILYELVSAERLDGLVIWGSLLGQHLDQQEMKDFCQLCKFDAQIV